MAGRINKALFEKARGVRLDIGCGPFKQKGYLGMDIVPGPAIDIVHDIQKFPWPVPDHICSMILMSHVFEHIEPKYRFAVMDECWRIIRHDGQLLISCPYANSFLAMAHPAHYPCPNEAAFQFFDPDYQLWHSSGYVKPLPWKIVRCYAMVGGTIEVILEPRKDKKGKSLVLPDKPLQMGSVELLEGKEQDHQGLMPKRKKHGK